MRDVVVLRWCDVCAADGGDGEMTRVEAVESWTVGATLGESSRPVLKVLDLCGDHVKALVAPLADLLGSVGQTPELPAATRPTAVMGRPRKDLDDGPSPSMAPAACRVCGKTLAVRTSLTAHVYRVHLGSPIPQAPLRCPLCREDFTSSFATRMHLTSHHNRTALDDAYAAARSAGLTVT
jgi:hypothetical protein